MAVAATNLCVVVGLAVLGLATRARAQSDEFVIAYSSPAGYVPAKLHDLQTTAFVNDYNINGFFAGSSAALPNASGFFACPLLAVEEGVVTVGTLAHQNSLAVFSTSGVQQTGDALAMSTPYFFGLSYPQNFIGPNWNTTFGSSVYAVPATQGCTGTGTPATWTLYIKADYVVATLGNVGSHPSEGEGWLASSADVQSQQFAAVYNAKGGIWPYNRNVALDGCCVIQLRKGYLTYSVDGESLFVEPFVAGVDRCRNGTAVIRDQLQLGLRDYGAFPTINFTARVDFGSVPASSLPAYCASRPPQSLALCKVHPTPPATPAPVHTAQPTAPHTSAPSPRTPAPSQHTPVPSQHTPAPSSHSHGDCYQVSLQVSYFLPNMFCGADRWHFVMRMNETYESIEMTSIDDCNLPIKMHNVTLLPYTQSDAVVFSDSGATQCSCNGSQIVPYNATGAGGFTNFCQYSEGLFNWCVLQILFDDPKPLPCPPSPPKGHGVRR